MSIIGDSVLHALQAAISRETTQFENTKSSITRTLLRPAAILIGSEAAIVGIIGAIKIFRVQAGNALFELVGSASENLALLTGMVIATYVTTLAANIYRSYLAHKSQERIITMAVDVNKHENFKTLSDQYRKYIASNQFPEARAIASWMMSKYPEQVEKDRDLVRLIAADIAQLESNFPSPRALTDQ